MLIWSGTQEVDKDITSVWQSQEAEATANYRNEPQDRDHLPKNNKEKDPSKQHAAATENK